MVPAGEPEPEPEGRGRARAARRTQVSRITGSVTSGGLDALEVVGDGVGAAPHVVVQLVTPVKRT
eukprot:6398680-Prymnesium_polylepis.1